MDGIRRSVAVVSIAVAAFVLVTACSDDGDDDGDDAGSGGEPGGVADIEDTNWTLDESSLDVEVPDDVEVTASFADGRMSGSSGCNNYGVEYTEQDGEVELGPITSTQMACEPAVNDVEAAFVAALEQVTAFTIDGETLQLTGDDGEVLLTFEPF